LTAELPDGKWVAVRLEPGTYATGATRAAAEKALGRKPRNRSRNAGEDAQDLATIELYRHERMVPFAVLEKKYCK
jgi:hypothetical protein